MDSIGVGIVGYGLAGRIFHKMLIEATPGLRVAAITARSPETLQRAREENPEAAVLAGFEELVAHPAVDLVVLATPHHVHCAQTVAALGAGKPVVVDKIMACSVAEADAMLSAARRAARGGQLRSHCGAQRSRSSVPWPRRGPTRMRAPVPRWTRRASRSTSGSSAWASWARASSTCRRTST